LKNYLSLKNTYQIYFCQISAASKKPTSVQKTTLTYPPTPSSGKIALYIEVKGGLGYVSRLLFSEIDLPAIYTNIENMGIKIRGLPIFKLTSFVYEIYPLGSWQIFSPYRCGTLKQSVEYGIEAYFCSSATSLDPLLKIQHYALRICTGALIITSVVCIQHACREMQLDIKTQTALF